MLLPSIRSKVQRSLSFSRLWQVSFQARVRANQNLVSQQDRFGNNRTDSNGTTKPDDDDDRMQKKGESVAHSQDGIRVKTSRIHAACGIRHPQVPNRHP